jgi:hypothetical protein
MTNIFDRLEEAPMGAGSPVRWSTWAPRRPHERFDLKLLPRSPAWQQDAASLQALAQIEREPRVSVVTRNSSGVALRLDDEWIETTGAALEAGDPVVQAGGPEPTLADLAQRQRFSVQFWDANATKALHVGHLRNLAIGNALAAALTQAGAQVERRSLISDVGRSMGEAMAGVRNSHRQTLSWPDANEKSDHFVGACYAEYVASVGSFTGTEIEHPEDSMTRELSVRDDAADELVRCFLRGPLTCAIPTLACVPWRRCIPAAERALAGRRAFDRGAVRAALRCGRVRVLARQRRCAERPRSV